MHIVFAASVLGDSHPPDKDGALGFGNHPREIQHAVPVNTAGGFEFLPGQLLEEGPHIVEADSGLADKIGIEPAFGDHPFQHAVEESHVTARLDLKEAVCNSGPE